MNRYRRVWVVYRKELLETLRDRRTLIAMVLVPIVLYPVLMVVLVEAMRKETGRRQTERYSIIVLDAAHRDWLNKVLERDEVQRRAQEASIRLTKQSPDDATRGGDVFHASLRADQLSILISGEDQSLWDPVARSSIHAALLVQPSPNPADLEDDVNRIAQFIYRDTDPRSQFVYERLARVLNNESDRIISARVQRKIGGPANLTPLLSGSVSTSSPSQQYAKILAMIVPFLLVTMAVTGAMYPAIDLTAGERERGTLETLAVSPVPVGQIVAGKFMVIVTISMLSASLNLGSMIAMVQFTRLDKIVTFAGAARRAGQIEAEQRIERSPSPTTQRAFSQRDYLDRRRQLEQEAQHRAGLLSRAAPIVMLAMIPFTVLASAVMLAVCSFARTFKEAQNYMMPVMMAAIIPAMVVSYMPTIRLEGPILVMPVANIVALVRELFMGNWHGPALAICLLSTCFYAVAAVAVAAKLYGHEAVLFSDVGSYKTLLSRRHLKPGGRPWPALVLLTVAVVFPLYFYAQTYFADPSARPEEFALLMAFCQVLILAATPLLVAWYLKLNIVETFSFRGPSVTTMLGALLIAASIVPVGQMAAYGLGQLIPWLQPGDEVFRKEAALLTSGPLLQIVLAFAVVPGVCEELLFRGFLQTGLRQKLSTAWTVVIVGLIFGIFHIHVEKIPIVSLIGMLLTFICLRSGSIFPGMLVHVANNGLALACEAGTEPLKLFFGLPAGEAPLVFDLRAAVFLATFIVGLGMIAWSNPRKT